MFFPFLAKYAIDRRNKPIINSKQNSNRSATNTRNDITRSHNNTTIYIFPFHIQKSPFRYSLCLIPDNKHNDIIPKLVRSEERRVGKECRVLHLHWYISRK